jgi:hypothetical protein
LSKTKNSALIWKTMAKQSVDSTAMEQVPMAHMSTEEDIVVVDLDDIIAAAEAEEGDEPEPSLTVKRLPTKLGSLSTPRLPLTAQTKK